MATTTSRTSQSTVRARNAQSRLRSRVPTARRTPTTWIREVLRRLYESGTAAGHALRAGLYFRTRNDVVVETARGARSVPECEMLTGLTPAGVVEPRVDYAYVFEDDYRLESEPAEHDAESDAELDGDLAADAAPITDGNIWRDQEVLGMPRRVLSGLALGALGVLLGIVLGASILIAAAWLLARVAGLFGG